MKLRILLLPGSYRSPAARFRIWQFKEPLEKAGYDVVIRVPFPDREKKLSSGKDLNLPGRLISLLRVASAWWITRDAHKFSAVITNRDIVPELNVNFIEHRIIKKGGKLIFDFDDAIHLGLRGNKLKLFLPDCAYLVGGNPLLCEYAMTLNRNTVLIPTVVNTDYYVPIENKRNDILQIGWSGSSHTNKLCLPLLEEPIKILAQQLDFRFVVISNQDPEIHWEGVNYEFIKWNPQLEVEQLQRFDIGLMPLYDMPVERGKCGLKAIQYMALGIPALVSPVGVNVQIVEHGINGYHCDTIDDWIKYLTMLYSEPNLRKEIGASARQRVESYYSVNHALKLWQSLLNE